MSADDAGMPALKMFTREGGRIQLWGGEAGRSTSNPGQDPRGAPDLMPMWTILDCTPEKRSI